MAHIVGSELVPADPENLPSALSRAMGGRSEGEIYRLSASTNMVVLASCRGKLSELYSLIDSLCLMHPGRYFAIYEEEELREARIEVSARCYGLGKGESLCSEVVMIGISHEQFESVPSLIYGHLLTGNPLEVFLSDPCTTAETAEFFLPAAERVIINSSHYYRRPDFLRNLLRLTAEIVDVEWIALSPWRRQVARAFELQTAAQLLPDLSRLLIRGDIDVSLQPFLLAGWICEKLRGEVVREKPDQFRVRREGGGEFDLVFEKGAVAESQSGVSCLDWEFAPASDKSGKRLMLRRNSKLEIEVDLEKAILAPVKLQPESWGALLRQYFEGSEYTRDFRDSLEKAMNIFAS